LSGVEEKGGGGGISEGWSPTEQAKDVGNLKVRAKENPLPTKNSENFKGRKEDWGFAW